MPTMRAVPLLTALFVATQVGLALAQAPAAPTPPAASPAPEKPAPTSPPADTPAPPAATPPAATPAPPTATPPAATPTPPATDTPSLSAPSPLVKGDAFGEEVTLPEKTVLTIKGTGTWDSAFDTLVDAFKSLDGLVKKDNLKTDGLPMTVYTSTDDTGFQYQAEIPLVEAPKVAPKGDITIAKSPTGKAYKFVHRGSYDSMDTTYEAITNFLDEKRIEANDMFIEEYVTDPVTTDQDKLVINVYVPIKAP